MSIMDLRVANEKAHLSHNGEKEKTVRHSGCVSWSYSVKKLVVGVCLLLVDLCERFTFFEVVCNMIPFCTVKLGRYNYQAAILNSCFIGTSILASVFAGWLADVCLGRNTLAYVCLFLHFLGSVLLPAAAFPSEDLYIGPYHVVNSISTEKQSRLFHVALLAIGLGTGGIRALVCPPGAYSFWGFGPQKQVAFCDWFYWILNFNTAIVFLGISYIQHSGPWTLVLLFPFISTFMALITFYMGHHHLIYQPEKCSSLLTILGVFANALKNCRQLYCPLDRNATRWLGQAKKNVGGSSKFHTEGVEFPLAFLPLFASQIVYRLCVMQIPSGYYLQTMNSNLNWDGCLLPVAVMSTVSTLALLILAPCLEFLSTCLLPATREGPFLSGCVIAGNLSAALSVMVAGFIEIHRKQFPLTEQPLAGQVLSISSMPCSHLILQYVLLGAAETLVTPAFSTITRKFVPSIIRGTSRNLLTLFNGFGCFTEALLIELVYLISEGNWFPNTLNKGNLESFFFFLASLTLLNVLGFWSVSRRYCNLNHFNTENISGSHLEETLLLHEKSLKFYGSTQEFSSSIDLWETVL